MTATGDERPVAGVGRRDGVEHVTTQRIDVVFFNCNVRKIPDEIFWIFTHSLMQNETEEMLNNAKC